ncbi:ABC transporter permease [Bacteroidia bacterium]|nr:ABC transporter permease [Bacteroidia bacterium]GHT02857.1 ABC transporter permease [Bacteroidia bacterium]GHT51563.1 ABC transporter permease [Bacteroidia bacterium]
MMIQYFKQAWNLIRQEKLFSSIYIIGTGLSITIVMVLSIVFYLKIANIYPETNRDRLLIIKSGMEKDTRGNINSSSLSYGVIEACFLPLESAEAVTATQQVGWRSNYIQPEGSKEQIVVEVRSVDNQFWTVFPFRFVDGKPFTEADFQSGIHTAVIVESLAKRLFGTTEVTGKQLSFNFKPYRISGVVKDASFVTFRVYAQVYIPYTVFPDYKGFNGQGGSLGDMEAYLLAPSKKEIEKVRQEAIDNIRKYNQTLTDMEFSVSGQPDRQWQAIFRGWSNAEPDFNQILLYYGLIFLILLLVPAVSLSGMTDSRMERRLAEMGVRRAFGAPVTTLIRQIISENFLFTVLGGLIGLLFSYLVILLGRNWIMGIGDSYVVTPPEGTVLTPAMLFNLPVFGIALGVCFLLNLLSSLIPAWRAARREIIFSLNAK